MKQQLFYEALVAYLHYAGIIGLACTLAIEVIVYRSQLSSTIARLLQRVDGLYGLASIIVLATGLVRSFYFGKGYEYYWFNYVFITKVGLFLIVGILSIWPTVHFLSWRKTLKAGEAEIVIDSQKAQRIRRIIIIELIILFSIPLLAALMARGFGFTA